MNDCLFKPISLTVLERQLAQIVPRLTGMPLDLGSLDALTGGDPLMSLRLLEELLSSSRHDRHVMVALLVRQAPLQDIIEQAHKLKGAARIVQANLLAAQCEALEQACARGDERTLIEIGIKTLEKCMLELERKLQTQLESLKAQG